jgi:hypothetical protein
MRVITPAAELRGAGVMTTFRFALLAVGLFALTFVGVSWANKGFPVMVMGIVPMKPDPRLPTFEESVKKGLRQDWENSKTSQSDGNRERDNLRRELLQASTGYALSPCNDTIRNDFVKALTNYTRAWYEMAHCRRGVGDCPRSEDDRFDAAVAAFKTPADIRVHEALQKAADQGGLSRDDFPAHLRGYVFGLAHPRIGEPEAACVVARLAKDRQ